MEIAESHAVEKASWHNNYTMSPDVFNGYQEAREAVARYSSVDGVRVDPQVSTASAYWVGNTTHSLVGWVACLSGGKPQSRADPVGEENKDVVLCSGCSCALDLAITVLANPGQNILVPRPGFSIYRTLAEGLGIRTKPYNLLVSATNLDASIFAERGWEADLAGLEAAIDEDTAAIVVNNPSNPCGSVFSKQHLRDILDIASRHRVPIIGDEIYEHLVFPGERYYSLGSLSEDVPILSCSGLTKRFLVPGWRMGWVVLHDRAGVLGREVRAGLQRLSQRIIGSNTIVQGALADILERTPQAFYDQTVRTLQAHARLAYDELSRVPGLRPVMPQGAMYMMVGIDMDMFPEFGTDLELVNQLVCEESVFVLPGQCFDFPGYVRLVLTVPEPQLRAACSRIRSFCARHHRAHGSADVDMDSQELPHLQTLQDMEVLEVDELDLSPRGADTFPNDSGPGAVGVGG
ncbi:tyrosine aminotransferase, partial [Olea europaea subsp. europaea]